MKRILFFSIPFFFICTCLAQQKDKFRPGQLWKDDKGVHINAHGGGMLIHKKRIIGLVSIKLRVKLVTRRKLEYIVILPKIYIIGRIKVLPCRSLTMRGVIFRKVVFLNVLK